MACFPPWGRVFCHAGKNLQALPIVVNILPSTSGSSHAAPAGRPAPQDRKKRDGVGILLGDVRHTGTPDLSIDVGIVLEWIDARWRLGYFVGQSWSLLIILFHLRKTCNYSRSFHWRLGFFDRYFVRHSRSVLIFSAGLWFKIPWKPRVEKRFIRPKARTS